MTKYSQLFLSLASAAAFAAGCSSSPASGDAGTPSGNDSGGAVGTSVVLMVDPTGWVDKTTNSLGIQGAWYAYGDGYGPTGAPPGDCQNANHPASACSTITSPVPGSGSYPPTGTAMCTKGNAAVVPTAADFPTIWGGGIGLDLNNSGGANAVKSPYDATANNVIGFSFSINAVPIGGIRVEMPMPSTTATAHFKTITTPGPQTVLFSEVKQGMWVTTPTTFDASKVLSVQLHVPTTMSSAVAYDFCVDKFAAITK